MKQEIKVFDSRGNYVRTYSVEDQGEDFMDLATMFAKKIGGSLDKPMDANSILERTLTDEEKKKLADMVAGKTEEKPDKKFCEGCNSKGVRHKKDCKIKI